MSTEKGRFRLAENVTYRLFDTRGKLKMLFQPNKIGFAFAKKFGFLPKLPLIFGFPSYSLNISNLVTNAGRAAVASRINGSGGEAAFTYVALGTGTTAANVADTTLETEIVSGGLERQAGTATRVTTDTTDDTAQLIATYTASAGFAVTESGVFNAASVGTMIARQVFSAINISSGDSLQITWKFDVD